MKKGGEKRGDLCVYQDGQRKQNSHGLYLTCELGSHTGHLRMTKGVMADGTSVRLWITVEENGSSR